MRTLNVAVLPEGYRELRRIDLQKNKKLMLFVNLLALVIAALLCVVGHQVVPVSKMFDMSDGIVLFFVRFGVMLGGTVLYIVLHEAVHGIFFRIYGNGVKPTFGFTGMYAFAASKAYFNRAFSRGDFGGGTSRSQPVTACCVVLADLSHSNYQSQWGGGRFLRQCPTGAHAKHPAGAGRWCGDDLLRSK